MCGGMAVCSIDVFVLVVKKIIIQQVNLCTCCTNKCAAGFALWLAYMTWTEHHHTQIDRIDIDSAQNHQLNMSLNCDAEVKS